MVSNVQSIAGWTVFRHNNFRNCIHWEGFDVQRPLAEVYGICRILRPGQGHLRSEIICVKPPSTSGEPLDTAAFPRVATNHFRPSAAGGKWSQQPPQPKTTSTRFQQQLYNDFGGHIKHDFECQASNADKHCPQTCTGTSSASSTARQGFQEKSSEPKIKKRPNSPQAGVLAKSWVLIKQDLNLQKEKMQKICMHIEQ